MSGIGLLQTQAHLPSFGLLSLCLVCFFFLHFFPKLKKRYPHPTRFLLGALMGFTWAALYASFALSSHLSPEWEGRDITLIGTIDNLPTTTDQGNPHFVRFQFKVETVIPQKAEKSTPLPQIPSRLLLTWYRRAHAAPMLSPGARWQLTVRLKRPHGLMNPYGFDYEAWLLERGIRATGYVRDHPKLTYPNQVLSPFVLTAHHLIQKGRDLLRQKIDAAIPNAPYTGVIKALVIGEQRAIPPEHWDLFRLTGTSHLVAISGLHITLITGIVSAVLSALWRHSFFTGAQLPLWLPTQKFAAVATVFVAFLYALLAGFGLPAQRAWIMLCVLAWALWTGRMMPIPYVLCLAAMAVLIIDPWAVRSPGFWLSFTAVALILYVTLGRAYTASYREKCWVATKIQGAMTLGLLPFTLLFFGYFSVISPLANALAIPVIAIGVTPLALIASVLPSPLDGIGLSGAHMLLQGVVKWLEMLSTLSWSIGYTAHPPVWMMAVAIVSSLWGLAPRGWPGRSLAWIGWLPLFLLRAETPPKESFWVTALDVGQGMALLVETPRYRLLYDTGPRWGPKQNAGHRTIVPYLRARGITHLDAMIISHQDSDHAGGALAILQSLSVGTVMSSLPTHHPVVQYASHYLQHRTCQEGQSWQWDGIAFHMLFPDDEALRQAKPNGKSCVLKVSYGQQGILLAGDIEKKEERWLLTHQVDQLPATVLLAPHHGSRTSSTHAFLKAVSPAAALFQVGYRNRFHHPRADVWQRYQTLGIDCFRTDKAGALLLRFEKDRLHIRRYREVYRRYWHTAASENFLQ